MRVPTSYCLFEQNVKAGLEMLSIIKKDPIFETTSWFLRKCFEWFTCMSSRRGQIAWNSSNFQDIADYLYIIENLKVGEAGIWKPIPYCCANICWKKGTSSSYYYLVFLRIVLRTYFVL